jgi:catechol O-methyltransferase
MPKSPGEFSRTPERTTVSSSSRVRLATAAPLSRAWELDFVFLDHAKEAYVPDLERILNASWLHTGSLVVADNVRFPGAPEYQAYMSAQEGKRWRTIAHQTHAEYQTLIKDVVLESQLTGS